MAIILNNVGNYVFNYSVNETPYINVDLWTITSTNFSSVKDTYISNTSSYIKSYEQNIQVRDYLSDKLMKDLASESQYLTLDGVNKQTNKITLHEKANDVFNLALNNRRLNSNNNINSIVSDFNNINSTVCLNDAQNANAFTSTYGEAVTYDNLAVNISVSAISALNNVIFLKDKPNAIGTNNTYTTYNTTSAEGQKCSNTAIYTMDYKTSVTLNETTLSNVWVISSVGDNGSAVAYTSNNLSDTSITWQEVIG